MIMKNLMLACIGGKMPMVAGIRIIDKSIHARIAHKIEIWMLEDANTIDTYSTIRQVISPASLHFSLQSHKRLTSN